MKKLVGDGSSHPLPLSYPLPRSHCRRENTFMASLFMSLAAPIMPSVIPELNMDINMDHSAYFGGIDSDDEGVSQRRGVKFFMR